MKKVYKLFSLLIMLTMLVACTNEVEDKDSSKTVEPTEETVVEEKKVREEPKEVVIPALSQEQKIDMVVDWLGDGMEGSMDVEYMPELHAVNMSMSNQGLREEFILSYGDKDIKESMDNLLDSINNLSRTVSQDVDDKDIYVMVTYPLEDEFSVVQVSQNGEVLFNIYDDVEYE